MPLIKCKYGEVPVNVGDTFTGVGDVGQWTVTEISYKTPLEGCMPPNTPVVLLRDFTQQEAEWCDLYLAIKCPELAAVALNELNVHQITMLGNAAMRGTTAAELLYEQRAKVVVKGD